VTKAAAALQGMPQLADAPAAPVAVAAPAAAAAPMAPAAGGTYRTLARFSGLQEWVAMRQALARVPGVGVVDVRSISPSQANIEFTYNGEYGGLMQVMAQNSLQLTPLPPGAVATAAPGSTPPQYLLNMTRSF
jgi:hypothetical protein